VDRTEHGVILITPEALQRVVRDAVRDAIGALPKAAPPLMTPAQVAARLSVCTKTVLNPITKGQLPAKRIGKQWRIRLDDLERWEHAQ